MLDLEFEKLMLQSAIANADCGTPFSTAMAVQWILRELKSHDSVPESLSRVYSWLRELSQSSNQSYPTSVLVPPSKWQRGCPEVIPGLRSMPWWRTTFGFVIDDVADIVARLEAAGPKILEELLNAKSMVKFQEYRAPKFKNVEKKADEIFSSSGGQVMLTGKSEGSISPLGEKGTSKGDWNVLYLDLHGISTVRSEAVEYFPFTSSVLDSIPRKYGHSLFSTLQSNTHVSVHTGPTNRKLRIQLPLLVPSQKGSCRLRVGPEVCELQQFKCLVFDDSYQHEAWNDSNEPRIVLIMDIWHPDLSDLEIKFLDFLRNNQLRRAKKLSKDGAIPPEADFFSVIEIGKQLAQPLDQVLRDTNPLPIVNRNSNSPELALPTNEGGNCITPIVPLDFAPCRAD